MKGKSKSFIFILGASIVTLIVLIIGSIIFAKDSSLAFSSDGYIITSNSEKYYFKAGTTYKENLDKEYTFTDDNKNNVSVSKTSFIHYNDNSIGFMKNGAVMDLNSANMSIVPYYNITNKSTINYDDGKYVINTVNGNLEFDDILGRISDDKYIVAGKNITLKLPEVLTVIPGEYFEINFIEDGVVRIENQEVSYQTTTQNAYIYVGDKIVIDFGSMKVIYDGEAEMSLSQITIDGNENIDILPDDNLSVKEGENIGGPINDTNDNISDNNVVNNTEDILNNKDNNTENKNEKEMSIDSYIDLIEASVSTNAIRASFKYNNTSDISGNLILSITDISNGNKVYNKVLDKNKSTDDVVVESLSPNTNYLMTIYSSNNDITNQYFAQSFRTENLGVVLNKVYVTSNSLTYRVDYQENTNVSSVTLSLYDENNNKVGTSLISTYNNNEELTFSNLDSNTSYTVKVDSIVMDSLNYVNVYNIERTDITLKKAPDVSTMEMEAKGSKNSAYLSVSDVTDSDSSIKSYNFNVYSANYNGNGNNEILYSKNVVASLDTTSSSLKLDINDLPSEYRNLGYYRFSVDIIYYDNEKTITIKNGQISSAFYMTLDEVYNEDEGIVSIEFEQDKDATTYSSIVGKVSITDKDHKIFVKGRDGYQDDTTFTVKYYSGDMSTVNSIDIDVSSDDIDSNGKIVKDISLTNLTNNSGYIIEVYAMMYDEDGNIINNIIDRSFTGTTKSDVDKLKFTVTKDNLSDDTNIINFDGIINSTNAQSNDYLSVVTAKLYKGSIVEKNNQIGDTITISGEDIFNNSYNFTNNSFGITDVLDLTIKSGDTLYQNYTVELTEAYYVSGNLAQVENNVYTYTISLAYMLERQLDVPTIIVEPILNYNYDSSLDDTTIVGYEITAGAAIEKLKSLLGNLGIESINYYIYKLDDSGNETLIHTVSSDQLSTKLYFNDIENYNRGGRYIFKYDISIAGLSQKYPTKPVTSSEYDPEKQSPLFTMYKSYTTMDSVVYKYKFMDIDDAIHKESDGSYKFYYSIGNDENYYTKDLIVDGNYQELLIDNLNKDDDYVINFYNEIIDGRPVLVNLINDKFESIQNIDDAGVKYELEYSPYDNRLGIHMLNNDFLDRIILYKVTIEANDVDDYVQMFNNNDLTNCPTTGDDNCLIVDYAKIKKFIGKDTHVLIQAYYKNGLSGIDLYNTNEDLLEINLHGYVFENSNGYLSLNSDGEFKYYNPEDKDNNNSKNKNSYSIYKYSINGNVVNIVDYFDDNINNNVDINYLSNGIEFKNVGKYYYPKGISVGSISSDNNNFRFDSYIPKVNIKNGTRTISKVSVGLGFSGLDVADLKSQFKLEDDNYYVYVELFDNSELSGEMLEGKIKISLTDSSYKVGTYTFEGLEPATTYYYKLYAYLKQSDGTYQKVELFDAKDANGYSNSTYEVSTRTASEILSNVAAFYDSTYYNHFTKDGSSYEKGRYFRIQYNAFSYVDYKLKIQLLDNNDVDYFDDKTTPNIEEKIVNVSNSSITWFGFYLDDDFVFGNGNYTLVLTAISNDGNSELELYRKSLVSTYDQSSTNLNRVYVSELNLPKFEFVTFSNIEQVDGHNKYTITADITPVDTDRVILNSTKKDSISAYGKNERGKYKVSLLNSNNEVVSTINKEFNVSDGTKEVVFEDVEAGSYYKVVVETYIYRNNSNLSESEKLTYFSAQDIVFTSSSSGVSLGSPSLSAKCVSDKNCSITVNYTGSSNMKDIDRVTYSIYENGGSSVGVGEIYKTATKGIFTIINDSNCELTFNNLELSLGKTYLVELGYYRKDDSGNYVQLFENIPYTVVYK